MGDPELIIFSGSSTKVFVAVAYARWKFSKGSASSHLLCSKNSITPSRQISIPRLELCGTVIASHLRSLIKKEMKCKFITDSVIVKSQIQKESFRFNTFIAN